MPSYLERRPRAFLHGIWETLQTGGWIRLAKGALIRQLTLTVCALAGILPSAKHKADKFSEFSWIPMLLGGMGLGPGFSEDEL